MDKRLELDTLPTVLKPDLTIYIFDFIVVIILAPDFLHQNKIIKIKSKISTQILIRDTCHGSAVLYPFIEIYDILIQSR